MSRRNNMQNSIDVETGDYNFLPEKTLLEAQKQEYTLEELRTR